MIIDIDIGNTRAKWRLSKNGVIVDRGFSNTHFEDWGFLIALRNHNPHRVRVSNVAGGVLADKIRTVIYSSLGLVAEFAVSSAGLGVVVSGYQKPEQLGVDRWLAILAGWDLFQQRCVVVDAGSALTCDFIDANACHQGGYIVPGQKMMGDALLSGTSGVRVDALGLPNTGYGQNTYSAVKNGCLAMSLALIENIMAGGGKAHGYTKVVLTGGDAELLLARLPEGVVYKSDLVLDGLALALP